MFSAHFGGVFWTLEYTRISICGLRVIFPLRNDERKDLRGRICGQDLRLMPRTSFTVINLTNLFIRILVYSLAALGFVAQSVNVLEGRISQNSTR